MAAAARPSPELIEDAVAEILLRLLPDEPARLLRASSVCKLWRRILSDPAFPRRYRRFHRTPPPLLGFFKVVHCPNPVPHFIPTTAPSPFPGATFFYHYTWLPIDCRHGRVLLQHNRNLNNLLVWDPVTGDREELPGLPRACPCRFSGTSRLSAAVLCAAAGCDHCHCHGGHFLVVCVDNNINGLAEVYLYSSQIGEWSVLACFQEDGIKSSFCIFQNKSSFCPSSAVLIGDEIYFTLMLGGVPKIVSYDLGSHCLSLISLPELRSMGLVLMPTEEGLLGLAGTRDYSLFLWSRMVNAEGVAGWVQCREIDLETTLPIDSPIDLVNIIGFAEGVNVIFVATNCGTFIIDLKSGQARKVNESVRFSPVVPFMSFYTPGCACSRLPLPAETN
ncbi:unnamed protein product [Urochloa decumbens]|uniref:F-box domain-containing protein n=1 Tax=Urochloa decumbens TaxID=240449 RepID=A0ABC9GDZ8_9POAL